MFMVAFALVFVLMVTAIIVSKKKSLATKKKIVCEHDAAPLIQKNDKHLTLQVTIVGTTVFLFIHWSNLSIYMYIQRKNYYDHDYECMCVMLWTMREREIDDQWYLGEALILNKAQSH